MPKPTLLRILKTLTGRDLVWQRMADGAYIASYTFSKRAGAIDEEAHFAEAAAPFWRIYAARSAGLRSSRCRGSTTWR